MKKIILIILSFIISTISFSQTFRDSVDVINYDINLLIDNFSDKQISGNTTITLIPVFNQTEIIKLDLLDLNIDKVLIDNRKTTNWTYNNDLISIHLQNSINKTDTTTISIYYNGSPKEDASWGGFYFSRIDAFNMGVGMSAVPHSFGRTWFPCIDNFTDKATYNYNITTNNKYKAVCGGILTDVTNLKKDQVIYHWEQKNAIPTYLASVSVSDYEIIKDVYNGIEKDIPIEIYTYKGKTSATKKSLINLHSAMNIFETLFGAYSWDRIGYNEISFGSGAMEHAENISISKYAFNGSLSNESLIYHELAHSWFGNLVTCKTAEDMWLNEGWASYCESIFFEHQYGNQKFRDYNRKRNFEVLHLAHQHDKGYRSVANMALTQTYGKTVYEKGANVIHTLRFYMGDSLFYPAVKHYLQKFAFSTASTQDFQLALEESSGINLTDFFDFWVYSKGFNFYEIENYTVSPNGDNFEVTVKINQRTSNADTIANHSKIEVYFMDNNFNTISKQINFYGIAGKATFTLPFEPQIVMLDLYEHITDATIDKYSFIIEENNYVFDESFVDIDVSEITDTTFVRVSCNVINPDNSDIPGYLFQKNYYWTINSISKGYFEANLKFYLTRLMDMNFTRLFKPTEFVLMYRENTQEKWHIISFELNDEYISTDFKNGQYALAIKTYE